MGTDELLRRRETAGQLLQAVLEGKLSPEAARNVWPRADGDASLDSAFHALFHFEDDADVRKKDSKYAAWQIAQLREMSTALLAGADLSKDKIEWLTPRPKQ